MKNFIKNNLAVVGFVLLIVLCMTGALTQLAVSVGNIPTITNPDGTTSEYAIRNDQKQYSNLKGTASGETILDTTLTKRRVTQCAQVSATETVMIVGGTGTQVLATHGTICNDGNTRLWIETACPECPGAAIFNATGTVVPNEALWIFGGSCAPMVSERFSELHMIRSASETHDLVCVRSNF